MSLTGTPEAHINTHRHTDMYHVSSLFMQHAHIFMHTLTSHAMDCKLPCLHVAQPGDLQH